MASAVDGVEQLETYYGKYLPQLLVTVLAPIGILIYLWSLDPPLAVVMGVFLPLALIGPWLFARLPAAAVTGTGVPTPASLPSYSIVYRDYQR